MGKQSRGKFSKSGRKGYLEYFCEIGMILRLTQSLELSKIIFAELKLDLENCLSEEKGEEELDLENSCPKKRKGERGRRGNVCGYCWRLTSRR